VLDGKHRFQMEVHQYLVFSHLGVLMQVLPTACDSCSKKSKRSCQLSKGFFFPALVKEAVDGESVLGVRRKYDSCVSVWILGIVMLIISPMLARSLNGRELAVASGTERSWEA
jgi:hypothetical protein